MRLTMFSGSGYAWRVLLGCVLKGVRCEEELIDFAQLRSPELLSANPRGKIPILHDGFYALAESAAILAYLDRRYPEPPLFGLTPQETGVIWQVLLDFDLYVGSEWTKNLLAPIFTDKVHERLEAARACAIQAGKDLAGLEARLGERDWLVGDAISAADIAIYPLLEGLLRALGKPAAAALGADLTPFDERYPGLDAWRVRIQALPGYESTYPTYWRQLDEA